MPIELDKLIRKQMKELSADFIKGAVKPEHFPVMAYPEAAFCGRSNVGKSSLINSLVHKRKLAKTSQTPGKTREINFFFVEESWVLADLPGFGYAAASKTDRADWSKLNFAYLENRPNLKLVCSLIDSRHDPMAHDLALIEKLELIGRNYIILLTKCDKISKRQIEERKEQIENFVSQCSYCREVLPYSAIDGLGREQLIGVLKKTLIL